MCHSEFCRDLLLYFLRGLVESESNLPTRLVGEKAEGVVSWVAGGSVAGFGNFGKGVPVGNG